MEDKSCLNCKYCVCRDYGYSNYTVEGTEVYCLLNMNYKFPVDIFYGNEPELLYATQCKYFTKGDCVQLDVEYQMEKIKEYSDDEKIKKLLKNYIF